MKRTPNEIYIAYESGHIGEARLRVERGATLVCIDFFVERELLKKNIPFVSLRDIMAGETDADAEAWWLLSHEIAREWYRLPAMKFFEYEGIRIAEAPEPMMGTYLARLFYYVRICHALKRAYPNARFSIQAPVVREAPDVYFLATFISWAIIDAARMAHLPLEFEGKHAVPKYPFPRPSWRSFFMRVYNTLIGLAPRRNFKIYASEYWTHVAPVVDHLEDTELILLESKKFYHIPWRQLLKHRIRIFYPNGEVRSAEEREVMRISEKFIEQWRTAKREVAAYLAGARAEFDWSSVLEACEYLVTYAPRVIADIRTMQRIMKKEKPDVVLQMASVGGPRHYFFLMARVAAQLGIPSLELQHAGATTDPRSIFSRIETDYLATYGADVNEWHERIGHAPERFIPVGSPRFDEYVNRRAAGVEKGKQLFLQLGLDPARPVLLAVVPVAENYVSLSDSYQLADYFEVIRAVQEKSHGLQVLFKFHNDKSFGSAPEYLRELFPVDSAIVGSKDIFPLLCASDAVVCNNSTVIYETVLAGKPLILYPWWSHDIYHARVYGRAAPLLYTAQKAEATHLISRMCRDASYREELLVEQKRFLEKYSFDGKSSERVAALLRDLPRLSREMKLK